MSIVGATLLQTIPVQNELGEGVIWDARGSALWWSDIEGRKIYRYQLEDNQLDYWPTPQRLGCFALLADSDYLICGFEGGFAYFDPLRGDLRWLHSVDAGNKCTRLNDGRADRQGRFWAGSMVEGDFTGSPAGALYCLNQALDFSCEMSGLSISNGLCWSPDSSFLYHTDTPNRRIDRYDFNARAGTLSNRTTWARTGDGCFPDGSTVDARGYLWNAQWGGSQVVRYSPAGEVDMILELPVSQPTCVAFGGPKLDLLFITSARQGLSSEALEAEPQAGNVFIFQTDYTGIEDALFRPELQPE